MLRIWLFFFMALFFTQDAFASHLIFPVRNWGFLFIHRSFEQIPDETKYESNDVLPLLFLEERNFQIKGLDLAYNLLQIDDTQTLSAVSKFRFNDMPFKVRTPKDDGFDMGLEYKFKISDYWMFSTAIMSDKHAHLVGDVNGYFSFQILDTYWFTYLSFLLKSKQYNTKYFAIGDSQLNSDIDTSFGVNLQYQFYQNFYLTGAAELTYFGDETLKDSNVRLPVQKKYILGLGFLGDSKSTPLASKYYHRLGFGFGTPTDTNKILFKFRYDSDKNNNKIASYFYGIPLADHLSILPLQVYFSPGIAQHLKGPHQGTFPEFIAMIKIYYTFPWLPFRTRIGLGEGLSYTEKISDIEKSELVTRRLVEPSYLLNYMDYSLDVSLGDIFRVDVLKDLTVGWYLHHRSGIYGNSSLFNRVVGGSNYHTFYLMYEF